MFKVCGFQGYRFVDVDVFSHWITLVGMHVQKDGFPKGHHYRNMDFQVEMCGFEYMTDDWVAECLVVEEFYKSLNVSAGLYGSSHVMKYRYCLGQFCKLGFYYLCCQSVSLYKKLKPCLLHHRTNFSECSRSAML